MRQLKFRAWDTENKRMYQPCFVWGDIQPANGLPLREFVNEFRDDWIYGNGNIVLEQWTGLQDKAGKDIYEGDVVRITDLCALESYGESGLMKLYTRTWVVEWGKVGYMVRFYDDKCGYDREIVYELPTEEVEFEVIGNIHSKEGDLT